MKDDDPGKMVNATLPVILSKVDKAITEVEELGLRNQFLNKVIESLEITLAHQRNTIARLEGERDLWRSRGEYK